LKSEQGAVEAAAGVLAGFCKVAKGLAWAVSVDAPLSFTRGVRLPYGGASCADSLGLEPKRDGLVVLRLGLGKNAGNGSQTGASAGVTVLGVAGPEVPNRVGAWADGGVGADTLVAGIAALEAPKSVGVDASLLGAVEPKLNRLEGWTGAAAAMLLQACALVAMLVANRLFGAGCDRASLVGAFEPKLKRLLVAGGAVWVDAPNPPCMLAVAVAVLGAVGAVLAKVKGVEAGAGVVAAVGAALALLNVLV